MTTKRCKIILYFLKWCNNELDSQSGNVDYTNGPNFIKIPMIGHINAWIKMETKLLTIISEQMRVFFFVGSLCVRCEFHIA